mgnify:FL=1
MKRSLRLMLATALAATVLGCASVPSGDQLIQLNYQAVDALMQGTTLDPRQPVLIATLVDLDDLSRSSRLGRLASEHVAARLAKHGVMVKELKLREQIFMEQSSGALLLSREIKDLSIEHAAQAVVVGTYTVAGNTVYVSLKLVRPEGNIVVSAHDYAFNLGDSNRALLR